MQSIKEIDYGHFSIDLHFNMNKEGEEWMTRALSFDKDLDETTKTKILDICQLKTVIKTLLRGTRIDTSIKS